MTRPEMEAEKLLDEHRFRSPPIDVERLAELLGVQVSYQEFEEPDVSGILYREDSRKLIAINKGHHANRKRFSIAHEIGHLLLHQGVPVIVDKTFRVAHLNRRDAKSGLATDRQEIEANQFAAALLMPRALVSVSIRRHFKTWGKREHAELIDALASEFEVSSQAMEYRLTNLGLLQMPF